MSKPPGDSSLADKKNHRRIGYSSSLTYFLKNHRMKALNRIFKKLQSTTLPSSVKGTRKLPPNLLFVFFLYLVNNALPSRHTRKIIDFL